MVFVLIVRGVSYQEFAASESTSPYPTNLMSSTLELNASRAKRAYRKILATIKETESTSAIARWDKIEFICVLLLLSPSPARLAS